MGLIPLACHGFYQAGAKHLASIRHHAEQQSVIGEELFQDLHIAHAILQCKAVGVLIRDTHSRPDSFSCLHPHYEHDYEVHLLSDLVSGGKCLTLYGEWLLLVVEDRKPLSVYGIYVLFPGIDEVALSAANGGVTGDQTAHSASSDDTYFQYHTPFLQLL